MTVVKIAVTAHRPDKLGGYDILSPYNLDIAYILREHLLVHIRAGKRIHAISGMALGGDTIFARVALKLKSQGYPVELEAAIPFEGQASRWPASSQREWQGILSKADYVTCVSQGPYNPELMKIRNCYMVDQCDELIAIYNGDIKSGTGHCYRYALEQDKPVIRHHPNHLIIPRTGDLLKSDCDVILHQANCQSVMKSGIADQIRRTYPAAAHADATSPLTPGQKLGRFTSAFVFNGQKEVEVVNLYGQLNYGRGLQTDYDALKSALDAYLSYKASRVARIQHLKIGLPKYMACARAGGDWNEVLDIIKELGEKHQVHFHHYLYQDN